MQTSSKRLYEIFSFEYHRFIADSLLIKAVQNNFLEIFLVEKLFIISKLGELFIATCKRGIYMEQLLGLSITVSSYVYSS